MNTVKLAIVIPFFKRKYFKNTLEALKNQTNKNFNVYIGNDGSPDDIENLIKEYLPSLNLTYKVFEHIGHTELSKHWDRCINMSKHEEWIKVLADDDVPSTNLVEQFYKTIQKNHDIHLIYNYRKDIDEHGVEINNNVVFQKSGLMDSKDFYVKKVLGITSLSISEQTFTRSAYESFGFKNFLGAFGSDDIAFLQFTSLEIFFYCNKSYVKVRTSPEHLSSNANKDIEALRIKGIKKSRQYVLRHYVHYFSPYQQLQLFLKYCILEKRFTQIPYHLGVNSPLVFGQLLLNNITHKLK